MDSINDIIYLFGVGYVAGVMMMALIYAVRAAVRFFKRIVTS